MTYGLGIRLFNERRSLEELAQSDSDCSNATSWNDLSAACRLAVIEQALRAASDRIDALPYAL